MEKMICSRGLECDVTECPHRVQHDKDVMCWSGTCSVNNDEQIDCIEYNIKDVRKYKLDKLNVDTDEESLEM